MSEVYEFKKSLEVGKQGEEIIERYLLSIDNILEVKCVTDDRNYWDKDIDFIVTMKDGRKFTIEVKTDRYKTNNIYYETKSCIENNTLGCFEKTKADFIFYYFINKDILYIFKTKTFRAWVNKEIDFYNTQPANSSLKKSFVYNKTRDLKSEYTSEGYIIPIDFLESNLLKSIDFNKYINIA